MKRTLLMYLAGLLLSATAVDAGILWMRVSVAGMA